MFISTAQIARSLGILESLHPFFGMSFLAFKESGIPVGRTRPVNFTIAADRILNRHYRPSSGYPGFYNPFRTSRRRNRWLRPRYGSTSLQRITKDTFSDALLHPSEQEWGWRSDYLEALRGHLQRRLISGFDLAVWLLRDEEWPDRTTPRAVQERFWRDYKITKEEQEKLFDQDVIVPAAEWKSLVPISEVELLALIGSPPGGPPPAGAALRALEMRGVGPAVQLKYEPAERLNIITGDNSLGKTFMLDCIWWGLTGTWVSDPAYPKRELPKGFPALTVRVGTSDGRPQSFRVGYDWDRQEWNAPPKRDVVAGLAIYARHDGSFAVWDPARPEPSEGRGGQRPQHLSLSREEVWNGTIASTPSERVCNGLIADWVLWQVGGDRYAEQFGALEKCLRTLSPSEQALRVGEPARLRGSQEIPTLVMPYGEVPVTIASAAVKRIAALAYLLVWTWSEHRKNALAARRSAQRAMVLIVDEVEAHLHPRWQRLIVPAIIQVVQELAPNVAVQVHLATHSPLVMASAETIFNEQTDDLHHLKINGNGSVFLEELRFVRRGTADAWLMSDVFGLCQPRSKDAEHAIEDAKKLQMMSDVDNGAVDEVNGRLQRYLAPDDEFWPRWRYFAKQHGVK